MRVLFVPAQGIGHSFPMVPLAWALRTAGHDVLFATTGPALAVRQAGLAVADVKPGWDYQATITDRHRAGTVPPEQMHNLREVAPVLSRFAELMVDGALDVATRWHPDMVVGLIAGLLVAAKLRVRLVDHGLGLMRSTGLDERLRAQMAPTFDRHGVTELPRHRVTLDVAPPSMLDQPPIGWSMRYVPYNGGTVVPHEMLPEEMPGGRPRIAVTFGTAVPLTDGLDPVAQLLTIAAQVSAEFLLALGDIDTTSLPPLPDNVRLLGWMPLNVLLAGIPQLVLPTGRRNVAGQAVQARGVGLSAHPGELTPALLTELIDNPHLHKAAAEVQAEIAGLPTPVEIVPRLADLASARTDLAR